MRLHRTALRYLILLMGGLVILDYSVQNDSLMFPAIAQLPGEGEVIGGRYFTARGTIKALVVFVQFAGDQTDPQNPVWPVDRPPAYMHSVVDSTIGGKAQNGSLTHYLREMSFGQLNIFGDAYRVVTDSSKQWYLKNRQGFSRLNRDVLAKLDKLVDYSEYDHWTFGKYDHRNEPDGVVDLVIIIHRENLPARLHPGNGVASLGSGQLAVEGGRLTIKLNHPGSGMSLEKGLEGGKTLWYAHELGHYLWGFSHPQYHREKKTNAALGFWGILFSNSNMVNAYEREMLGWKKMITVTEDSLIVTLGDYLSSGMACRIPIPGSANESFIIENHQELSLFDKTSLNGSAKGLYIYHFKGSRNRSAFDLEVAEGRFAWSNPYWIHNPWEPDQPQDSIPVFKRGSPHRRGLDARDAIPTSKPTSDRSIFKIFAQEIDGRVEMSRRVFGDPRDAFDIGSRRVFSPWSNPDSHQWDDRTPTGIAVEILDRYPGDAGEDIYKIKIYRTGAENTAPSNPLLLSITSRAGHPKLIWRANLEPDIAGYRVYRQDTSGAIMPVSGEELLSDTTWVDPGCRVASDSSRLASRYTYYIKSADRQEKISGYSNGLEAILTGELPPSIDQ